MSYLIRFWRDLMALFDCIAEREAESAEDYSYMSNMADAASRPTITRIPPESMRALAALSMNFTYDD